MLEDYRYWLTGILLHLPILNMTLNMMNWPFIASPLMKRLNVFSLLILKSDGINLTGTAIN